MVSGRDRDPAFRKKSTSAKKPVQKVVKPATKTQPPVSTPSPDPVEEKVVSSPKPTPENKPDSTKEKTKTATAVAEPSKSNQEKPQPTHEEKSTPTKPNDGSKTSKKSKLLGILIAILFLIGLIAIGYIVIQSIMEKETIEKLDNSFSNEGIKSTGPNSTDAIDEDSEEKTAQDGAIGEDLSEGSEETNSGDQIDAEGSEATLSNENNMESEMKEAKEEHSEKTISDQEKEAIKSKIIRKKGEFELPSWIIAFSANSKKPLANTNYSTLEALGYDAGIYWIPKYFPGGKEMYKVYVGPYKSEAEAESVLPAIRNLQPDAYVLKIEE